MLSAGDKIEVLSAAISIRPPVAFDHGSSRCQAFHKPAGELVDEVKRRGSRGVSGFVARAVAHELQREQLSAFVDEMNRELGPVFKSALAAAKRAWRMR